MAQRLKLYEVPRGVAVSIDGSRYYVRRTDGMYTQLVKCKKHLDDATKWVLIDCFMEVELWHKK